MKQQRNGIQYEFESTGRLSITSNDWSETENFVSYQVGMLQSRALKTLFPITIEHWNDEIVLRINIIGYRSLHAHLLSIPYQTNSFIQLLLQIISTIEEVPNYLLTECHLMVFEDLIFVSEDGKRIGLIYLPVVKLEAPFDTSVQLAAVIKRIMNGVQENQRHLFVELHDYVKRGAYSYEVIKDMLLHINNPNADPPSKSMKTATESHNRHTNGIISSMTPMGSRDQFHQEANFAESVGQQKAIANTLYISMMILMVSVIFYTVVRFTSYGLTMAVGTALVVTATGLVVRMLIMSSKANQNGKLRSESGLMENQPTNEWQLVEEQSDAYYNQLPDHTTLLTPSHATVLLAPSPAVEKLPVAALERIDTGARFPIEGTSFLIGREEQTAQLPLDEIGVSRSHLEVIRSEGSFLVKDLGSVNGSYLNSVKLIPFRAYPIIHGDNIQVVHTIFTFTYE